MPTLTTGAEGVIAYDEYGAGPVVVLLHGSPGTSKAWSRVAERLGDRFRVIVPNLPGHGETSAAPAGAPPDNAYAARLVEALLAEVDALRRLPMPVQVVCGTRSPEAMIRICRGIASHAPQGSLVTLEKATHALTATHVEAVADLIAALAARDGH